jgi:hypothetical protein
MPSTHKFDPEGSEIQEAIPEDDIYNLNHVEYDSDGNPYIIGDLFNLAQNPIARTWHETMQEDIIDIWEIIKEEIYNRGIPLLEKGTIQDFARFVAAHSSRIPPAT